MKKSPFTLSIEKRLQQAAPKKTGRFKAEDYIGGASGSGKETSRLKFLNMTMPALRHQLTTLGTDKKDSHSEERFEDMQRLWFESDIFEAKSLAIYWLDRQRDEFLIRHHRQLLKWADHIDNWAHSDGLCSIYARMFDEAPERLMPTYRRWNSHRHSWLRRCSMVGVYYYSRQRRNHLGFAEACRLVSPHFEAPEYYVQKGVGWTIREMYNVYPAETVRYIKNNLHRLSPIAWVAASEKLPPAVKTPLLRQRKLNRQARS